MEKTMTVREKPQDIVQSIVEEMVNIVVEVVYLT